MYTHTTLTHELTQYTTTLTHIIPQVTEHRLVGGKHPWYVFRGHPIPGGSEGEDSLVQYIDMPTPRLIQKAFERMYPMSARGKEGVGSRDIFVNAQWALGGEGTGAPVSAALFFFKR